MEVATNSSAPVYSVSGASSVRLLPEWLAKQRRRGLKQDADSANRIELLQDFEFEEASICVRASEDGNWLMSTGTYKPQIHTHYLPNLSLSYARHTDCLNKTFLLLTSDISKSAHLQSDRSLQFHTLAGCHYTCRIPRYGRDLAYNRRLAELLVPASGLNEEGFGEVFRINLELGRFMKGYDVDVGGDESLLDRTALQGGVQVGSVNTAAVAEESHGLLAFGTSIGTVEFWDHRSQSRVTAFQPSAAARGLDERAEVTALDFHRSGLTLATGFSNGLVHLYDLRSPKPLLKKDQGYGYPIQTLKFLTTEATARAATAEPKILSADRRIIKLWDERTGDPWTSVEPAVDLNHVTWVPDTGMLMTANEGRQQHSFFIPQLGPAPRWCSFLDNLVEEMAEDAGDPNRNLRSGQVYDNYKFLTIQQLRALSLDHLVGTTSILRPYMHGYFVPQRLYEEAKLISNPDLWLEQRSQRIQQKIEKERESRIRGHKKVSTKVNRKLAEKLIAREEAQERRHAQKLLRKGITADAEAERITTEEEPKSIEKSAKNSLLTDKRFAKLFQDAEFAVDETSREFQLHNPSTKVDLAPNRPRALTVPEEEEITERHASSSDESSVDPEDNLRREKIARNATEKERDGGRISSASYRKSSSRNKRDKGPQMRVSSSTSRRPRADNSLSFGARAASAIGEGRKQRARNSTVLGEKEITFAPQKKGRPGQQQQYSSELAGRKISRKDRRSASGNVMRGL
ncbi:MAG: Nucleolar protein 10 [Bogoriella megaspora]|nr:MAG: Nucleolar protein 10 [Bogoriella megaspora]